MTESGQSTGRRVAIVGGGISGLVAAFRSVNAGDRVTLFEAAKRFGGPLESERSAGFLVEHGAEGFVSTSSAVRKLARDLDLTSEIIEQQVTSSYSFEGNGLVRLEPGVASARLGLAARSGAGAGVATFRLGMGQLVDALVDELRERAELRPAAAVRRIRSAGNAWQLEPSSGCTEAFDAVILACDGRAASQLLGDAIGEPAKQLSLSRRVPSITVSLAYARAAIEHPLDGTGFVVAPGVELEHCIACTFASAKFAGRASAEYALVRLFFRPSAEELLFSEGRLAELAARVCARVLQPSSAPVRAWASVWPDGFAVVDAEQQARVRALEAALEGRSLLVAGAAFHGAGIDAAVCSGERAAAKLWPQRFALGRYVS